MVEKYSIRTDLALEEKERFEEENVEVQGVVLEEEYDEEDGKACGNIYYNGSAKSCRSG